MPMVWGDVRAMTDADEIKADLAPTADHVYNHLSETELTERLDEGRLLDAARGPGCYALAVNVPDDRATVCEQWDGTHEARPPDGTLAQLAAADDVAYVGASGHVYDRLRDHAAGDVRTVSLLSVFDPTAVIDVWPDESPFAWEYNCAKMLAQQGWTVWCNGEVVG